MVSKVTTVLNPSGIHARPASLFVQCASGFKSSISVRDVTKDGDAKDAKSILMVMSLGMACGDQIEIVAEGEDDSDALEALVSLVDSGCGSITCCRVVRARSPCAVCVPGYASLLLCASRRAVKGL